MTSIPGDISLGNIPDSGRPTMEVLRPRPQVAVLVLGGEHDLDSAAALELLATEALESSDHVVFDLSAVQFLDSSTIAVLVRAKRRADEQGARFVVVMGTSSVVLRGLEVSGVLPALNAVWTLDEALLTAPSE